VRGSGLDGPIWPEIAALDDVTAKFPPGEPDAKG